MSGEDAAELRFEARADQLAGVRQRLREELSARGVAEEATADIVLAVDEACQNIIRHCYAGDCGDIEISVRRSKDAVEIVVRDFGPAVEPAKLRGRALDDLRPGGLGIHFIESVMDEVAYADAPEGCGNALKMVKRIG